MDSAKSVQMNITYEHEAKTDFDINLERIKQKLRDEIAGFEKFLSFLVKMLDLLIYPIFISPFIMVSWTGAWDTVLFQAVIYIVRFNRGEEVDNYFLTKEFDQIDTKRQANGKSSILPLLPAERKKVRLFMESVVNCVALVHQLLFRAHNSRRETLASSEHSVDNFERRYSNDTCVFGYIVLPHHR